MNIYPNHHGMILMAGNSLINNNVDQGKNLVKEIIENIAVFLTNPGKINEDAVMDYMRITEFEASILTTVLEMLRPVAFGLIVAFFCLNLIKQYTALNNNFSILLFVRAGLLLCVSIIALDYMSSFVSIFCNLSNSFAESVKESLNNVNTTSEKFGDIANQVTNIINAWDNAEFKEVGGSLIQSIMFLWLTSFSKLVNSLAGLITSIVVFAAKLEMLVRFAFSPIALSALASDDNRHQALHYLKKCLATALYCGGIMIMMYIASLIPAANAIQSLNDAVNAQTAGGTVIEAGSFAMTLGNSVLMTIIGPFSAIGAISVVKSTINEALGA